MKKISRKLAVFGILAVVMSLLLAVPVSAAMSPATLDATLNPGESVTVEKTVEIPGVVPKADVLFSFDLTGSMSSIISTAKAQAGNIMTALAASGADINYGVASYMDYPDSYSSYGYSATYGYAAAGDYAYNLDQAITSDTTAVQTAINGLTIGNGGDGPQDYTRIMYESYADPSVSWRSGARTILVNFGDNVPHDNNLEEGISAGTWSTGGDPGRDEVMFTGDDLDLQTVLAGMAANGVIMLECHTTTSYQTYWEYWTGITGGDFYTTSSSTLADDVEAAITAGLTVSAVTGLHLAASSGYDAWLTSSPAAYASVMPGDTVLFDETITVPMGTAPGTYVFTVSAVDDAGVSYGDQTCTITVPRPEPPIPEAPSYILFGLGILGIVGYMGFRQYRNSQTRIS